MPIAEKPDLTRQDRPFRRALSINLLNPKAILFFLSFFIQLVDPAYAYPALSFSILGLILQFFSLAYMTALIIAGSKLAGFFSVSCYFFIAGISAVGFLFPGFAIKLVYTTL